MLVHVEGKFIAAVFGGFDDDLEQPTFRIKSFKLGWIDQGFGFRAALGHVLSVSRKKPKMLFV